MYDKPSLRKHYATLRKNLLAEVRHHQDTNILNQLTLHPKIHSASIICCYVSFIEEVNTHPFISWCLEQGKTVCIPRVSNGELHLHRITSLDACIPGFKGILEPPLNAPEIQPQDVDLFVVLGLAFDQHGYRLGYGKGYTDKLLAGLHSYTIGICYPDQLTDALPHEDHDIPVDEVLSG